MKKLIVIAVTFFLTILVAIGQKIEIGQKSSYIKSLIEYQVSSYNNSQGYHQVNMTTNTKYENGKISDVILCYGNQYIIDFRITADFCIHYIMENDSLAYVLTQYMNISTEELKKIYDRVYSNDKSGELYISDDYEHYSKIYLASNGYATVEWRKFKPNELSSTLKAKISSRLLEVQKAKENKIQEIKEIKSKTYDLKEYDSEKFQSFVTSLRHSLLENLKINISFPSYYEIAKKSEKCFKFKNSYAAHYKITTNSKNTSEDDVSSENTFTLISGADTSCHFLKYSSPLLPTINYKGYTVMTEAYIDNITVDYIKSITIVKIKNRVIYYLKYIPSAEIQNIISSDLIFEQNGLYLIKYEIGNVMGDSFVTTEKKLIKKIEDNIENIL